MNICISGALGHIGSGLIRNLTVPDLGRVYLVDNFLTQRYASLFDLPEGIDFVFKEMDILSEDMKGIIAGSDVLVHLAAVTNAEKSVENNEDVEEINKKGLEHVAELCADSGCSLIFPSSTSVYGTQDELVDEDCPEEDLKPQSPYADSKIFGEKLLAKLAALKGLKYVTLRLGTIFGYSIGMRFHTAVNKFIWQASVGMPITVWRTALNQKRPYCGLEDCVSAINFFVAKKLFDCQVYNILTSNFTVKNIVDVIRQYVPDIQVSFVDSPIMNQLSYEVSCEKSQALGLIYNDNIEASVRKTLLKLRNVNAEIERIGM
ncbi:MAG: SDR family oxidoreductase [Deltaproteobacteria bacterium]|nr:SDR family oxidoreductase [Deltaproteobacteria bacterium]